MKLIITNSSGWDVWAIAARAKVNEIFVSVVKFFLTGDMVGSTAPEKVPEPPDGITVDMPDEPIKYLAPEGHTLKTKIVSGATPDGNSGILVNILEVIQLSVDPTRLPN